MDKKREAEGVSELGIIGIILTGLKIIGLLLLALLLILLLIIALFLFVPFKYKFRVKYIAEKLRLQGKISFLLKFIRAKFLYDDKLYYDLKVIFFTLASSEAKPEKKKAKPKKVTEIKEKTKEKDTEKIVTAKEAKSEQKESGTAAIKKEIKPKEDVNKEAVLEKKLEEAAKKEVDLEEKILIEKEQTDENNKKAESKTVKKKVKKKISIISKIKQKLEALKAKWKAFKDRVKSFSIKKDAIVKFLNADGTLSGAAYILTQGKRLLRMLLPKKIKGWLRFGTGDVYTQGQYLSYLCFLYPLYSGKIEINPEWDEEVFDMDMEFSGRITLFVILMVVLKLLFNKNVKLLRNNYNRYQRNLAKN